MEEGEKAPEIFNYYENVKVIMFYFKTVFSDLLFKPSDTLMKDLVKSDQPVIDLEIQVI